MLSRPERVCGVNQFSYAAYSCEMPESLFATFTSSDTFSQRLYSEVAAKFLAVLEAVSDGLCRAVNSNRNAINSYILDSLCQCLAGESDEAQSQATNHRLFRFKIDCHPNRGRVKRKKAVEPDCGLQANDACGCAYMRALSGAQSQPQTPVHLCCCGPSIILPHSRSGSPNETSTSRLCGYW